jgi:hypothetical protein
MPVVNAFYDAGQDITVTASAGATGGRCLGVPTGRNAGGPGGISDTGDGTLICPLPTANGAIFGVAQHDAAVGKLVDTMRPPKVVPIECNVAVAQGVDLSVNADGTVKARAAGQTAIGRNIGPATTGAGQYVQAEIWSAPASYA